ncbi:hypothetical protein LY78DRAFT_717887 [Colletotrichum sublineola]|nr:hypothetical protein LY78DRAFT_717887 [Colletotrichum sublineola]
MAPCTVLCSAVTAVEDPVGCLFHRWQQDPVVDSCPQWVNGTLINPRQHYEESLVQVSHASTSKTVQKQTAHNGDKGSNANVGFWVRHGAAWPSGRSRDRLIELPGNEWHDRYVVEECRFSGLHAMHFFIRDILQENLSSSSLLDDFYESPGEFLSVQRWLICRRTWST